jgi:hypothetical protein
MVDPVALTALWLPIVLSAVVVFVASSIIHMATSWHQADFKKFSAEDAALDALRGLDLAPGDYAAPKPEGVTELNSDEYKAKVARGPQVMLTVFPPGLSMSRQLLAWFVYALVVAVFAGYVASIMLGPGADYMPVFRVTSTVTFAGYALGIWQNWIWYSRDLGAIVRSSVDGLVYALLTGGLFGWLWP